MTSTTTPTTTPPTTTPPTTHRTLSASEDPDGPFGHIPLPAGYCNIRHGPCRDRCGDICTWNLEPRMKAAS